MNIRYINTDLEILSREDLTPIVESFGEDVLNLFNGKARGHFLATFETAHNNDSPDGAIQFFCNLIEGLEDKERKLWDQSLLKVFDIGYEGGTDHLCYTDEIRPNTLKLVASLNASIRITVYPMPDENDEKI